MKTEGVLRAVLILGIVITAVSAAYIYSHPPPTRIEKTRPGGGMGNVSQEELGVGEERPAEGALEGDREDAYSTEKGPQPEASGAGLSFDFLIPAMLLVGISAIIVPLALSMLSSRRALSEDLREDILAYLSVFPGSTPRELCEEFQVSPSAINHHIRTLERWDKVFTIKTQKRIYVFPSNTPYSEARKMAEMMDAVGGLSDRVQTIMRAVLEGARTQKEISERTSLPRSTISYVLKKLVAAGLIVCERENGRAIYSPRYENIYRTPHLGNVRISSFPPPRPPEGGLKAS